MNKKKDIKMKMKQRTIDTANSTTFHRISQLIIQKSFRTTLPSKTSIIFTMLILVALMLFTGTASGQTTYYYISGNHNTVGNWNTNPAGGGTAASSFAGASDIFIVPTGKTTVCNGGMTIANKLRIEGTLTQSSVSAISAKYWEVSSGGIINTSSNGGIAVAANGTFLCAGTVDRTGSASITFGSGAAGTIQNGGAWHHDELGGGSIPTMTWETGSTCRITKTASTASVITAASLAQEFYNLEWNYTCSGNQIFETNIPTFKSGGTFTIKNSGTGIIALGNSSTSISMTVPNLRIEGGTFAIKGSSSTAVNTLNISNTFVQTGGTFTLNRVNSAVNIPILNIAGNFECSGGTFNNNANASATGSVNFTKSGTQTFTLGGIIANGIEFTVNNGSTLEFATNATVLSNSSTNCKFTVASGGGLIIKHVDGISTTVATGCIRIGAPTPGNYIFNTAGNYTYNGTTAQTTGNALPVTVNNFTINNTSGVTLTNSITVNGTLNLTVGLLTLGSNNLTLSSSTTISGSPSASNMVVPTSSGELRKVFSANGSFTFPVGDNTSTAEYSPVTLDFTSGSYSSAYASVKLSNSKHGNNISTVDYINRYWTISTSGITTPTCTATFTYTDGDIIGTETNLFGGKYFSTVWNCLDAVNFGTNTFSKEISEFGSFTAGEQEAMGCASCANPSNGGVIGNTQNSCGSFDPSAITNIASAIGYSGTLEYQWQSSTTSNSSGFSDIGSATTATYDPANISVTTWYKRLARVSCKADWSGAISSNVIEMTVNAIPSAPTGSATQSYCAGATVANLSATGNSLKWYDAASGGSEVTSGTTLIDNTHYFASQTTNGCESTDRLDVLTTIHTFPIITGTTPNNRCGSGTVNLGATASTGTINWYDVSTGGTSLGSGETYTTPSISATTSYWVDATANSCTTASRTEVVASVGAGTSITAQPSGVNVCDEAGSVATFSVAATGNNLTYQWQESTNGTDWNNITDGGVYSNPTTNTLTITSPTLSMNSYQYRCDVGGSCAPTSINSTAANLGVSSNYCGTNGDYRTIVSSGNWGDASSWETHNGSAWVAAGTSPTNTNGVITIRSGHNITVAAAVSVDQVVVRSGGQVTVNGAILTIADGTGDDFVVNGILKLSSLHSVTTTGTLVINDGGIYEHARNSGSIPTATWNTGSELKITGVVATPPSITGTYQNVIWNCSGQTEAEVFNPTINGNLTVETTGTGSIELQNITIYGNFNMNGGKVRIAKTATSTSQIKGNCNILGGDFILADGGSNDYHANLTIDGDFTLDNNVSFKFCTNATVNGKAYLWLKKDLYLKNFTPGGFLVGTGLRNESSGFYLIGTQSQTVYSGIAFNTNAGMREFFFYKTAGGPTALNEVYNGSVAQYTINGMGANTNPFNPLTGYSRWPVSGDMLKNVTINNSSSEGVTLTTTKTVNTKLTLTSGTINTTDSLLLTMAAGTSVDGGSNSSYVNGPLRKIGNSAFTFPVGKSGAYAPISISAPAVITDHFTTYYVKTSPNGSYSRSSKEATLDHVSDCEYWILNRTNGSSNVNVTLSWDTRSCGVSNLTEMRVSRWDGTQWTDAGNTATTGNVSSGTVSSNTITSFSPFTLASTTPSNILPIDFLNFNIKCQPKGIDVYWQTASELNSNFIEIETSNNSIEWTKLGSIAAQGNSNTLTNYHFSAENENLFFSYYRLKMVDYNGGVVISTIKTIDCNQNDLIGSYDIIPNPNNGVFKLISNTSSKPILVSIYNSLGKLIYQNNQFEDGEIFVDISHFDKGLYLLKIRTNDFEVVKKVIIN